MSKAGRTMSKAGQDHVQSRGTDLAQTSLNMINCFIGAGILTVPFAFKLAGYGAVAALVLVAALNWCTSLLLGRALDKAAKLHPEIPAAQWDFGQLGLVAFGPTGRWLISVLFALELWFAMETFLVLTGINGSIVTGASRTHVIMWAGLAGLLSLPLPMRVVAGFSFLSVCCMAGGLVALVVCGMHSTARAEHKAVDPGSMVPAAGIFLYCFSGLPCLPNIRAGMRRPEADYGGAVHATFIFSIVYYATIGLLGYYFYGDATRESFTENLMPASSSLDVGGSGTGAAATLHGSFALLSAGLFAFKLQTGFPLYAAPVLKALGVRGTDDWECLEGDLAQLRCALSYSSSSSSSSSSCSSDAERDDDDGAAPKTDLQQSIATQSESVAKRRERTATQSERRRAAELAERSHAERADDDVALFRLWLARVVFVGVSVAFAVLAQGALDAVAELMGAFLTNFTSVIFPCAAYLKVSRDGGDELGAARAAGLVLVIAVGLVFAAVGSFESCARFWHLAG